MPTLHTGCSGVNVEQVEAFIGHNLKDMGMPRDK